jgi:hypothetical protein
MRRLGPVLYEALRQELTGIARLRAAARRAPASATDSDAAPAATAGLLSGAIERCRCGPGAPQPDV